MSEEIILSMEAVQPTERITDSVRKDEVYVDEEGVADRGTAEGRADES